MLCSACSSSDNPVDQEQEEDKYFFRYEVTCVSDSAQSIKKLYVITDNGNIITQMPEGKKTEWNATYGPVSKKCYIGLSCNEHEIPCKDISKEERRTFRPEERRQW